MCRRLVDSAKKAFSVANIRVTTLRRACYRDEPHSGSRFQAACDQPDDGTACDQPDDGTACDQPDDGTACDQPDDGTATAIILTVYTQKLVEHRPRHDAIFSLSENSNFHRPFPKSR